jgi:hypothetical protein
LRLKDHWQDVITLPIIMFLLMILLKNAYTREKNLIGYVFRYTNLEESS